MNVTCDHTSHAGPTRRRETTNRRCKPDPRRAGARNTNGRSRKTSTPRILIVGGDQSWVEGLRERLGRDTCEVVAAPSARRAVQRAIDDRYDLVVVAPDLPDDATLELCRGLRVEMLPAAPPPLLLPPVRGERANGAGAEGEEQVRNLADEIASLIHHAATALDDLRGAVDAESCVCLCGIEIDRASYRVTVDGRDTRLTPTEFRILWNLMVKPGVVFSRQQLLSLCVGDNTPSYERTIDVHIKAVRHKLKARGQLIETVRGIGYRFRDDPEPDDAGSGPDVPR